MIYTWLRHVKGCWLAQTNWKASPKWACDKEDLEKMRALANAVQSRFAERNWEIFKNGQSLEQALKQVESDVMGIAWQEAAPIFYAVESAFHENGLQYGSKEQTCAKVVSKLTRVAIAMYLYMPEAHCEVVFTAPKVNPNIMEILPGALAELNEILSNNGVDCSACLIANEEYNKQILSPVKEILKDDVSDTSELFARSLQLLGLFEAPRRASKPVAGEDGSRAKAVSEQDGENTLRPRYNTRSRNNMVCSCTPTPQYPSVCWLNISISKLNNPDLDQGHYYFYCMVAGKEYFYSIPVKELRIWLENSCKAITNGTPRYSFYIDYQKGRLTPDAAGNGNSLQLGKSDWI